MHKSTFMIDERLLKEAKHLALELGKPLREVIEEALRRYLIEPHRGDSALGLPLFEMAPPLKGKIIGDLRRASLYSDYLNP